MHNYPADNEILCRAEAGKRKKEYGQEFKHVVELPVVYKYSIKFVLTFVYKIDDMGIVHIPFCRSKCYYCGFYSVVSLQWKKAYIQALKQEMRLRKDYLPEEKMSTLYLGGGTPSLLEEEELYEITGEVRKLWAFEDRAEWSIEMNPEDATLPKLSALRLMGFNRISLGAQSFDDAILKRINRNHRSGQILQALENCEKSGFDNVGIDLIIGLPGSAVQGIEQEISIVKQLNIYHLSIYILSIDSNSVFHKLSEKGKFIPPDDDALAEQYLLVSEYLKTIDFEHYEISNFAKNFKYSRHNTAYWQQKPYLGLGPAAHSYDIDSRQWNVAHLKRYIDGLNKGELYFEKEILTEKDKFNEYLMTNFRTQWGIEPSWLKGKYPDGWKRIAGKIDNYCKEGFMYRSGEKFCMTERGWLISDAIFSELFM